MPPRKCCCVTDPPDCDCFSAKDSYRFTITNIALSGGGFSIPDRCLVGNALSATWAASTMINYDDAFCGESTGQYVCPAVQSHYFGPVTITVDGVNYTTYVAGRVGSCPGSTGPCVIVDSSPDAPTLCAGSNQYGIVPNAYDPSAVAGVGIDFFCRGGNLGNPAYTLYVSASYYIYDWGGGGIPPAAPTGWTRSGVLGSGNYLYTRNDNKATMSFNRVGGWHFLYFCNGVLISGRQAVWQLNAFTYDADVGSVALDYPFDPAGIFSGITGVAS